MCHMPPGTQPRDGGAGVRLRCLAGESALSSVPCVLRKALGSVRTGSGKSRYETSGTILSYIWNKFNIQYSLMNKT